MAEAYQRAIGPVEYLLFAFDGNQFKGEIIPALMDLVDTGMVRVIDLAVISKDDEETITIFEASELQEDVANALEKLNGEFAGLLSEEDLLMAAEALPPMTTAAALMVEHVWATSFAQAVRNANGWVVASTRIPADVVEVARESLIAAANQM